MFSYFNSEYISKVSFSIYGVLLAKWFGLASFFHRERFTCVCINAVEINFIIFDLQNNKLKNRAINA
jgi:hypothetical protein